jgi:hypothetical protein
MVNPDYEKLRLYVVAYEIFHFLIATTLGM